MNSRIESQVMASVGTIYIARQLVSATALKLYICALSVVGLWKLVWVHRVFENFSQVGIGNAGNFIYAALINAGVVVLVVLAVLVVAGVSLIIDFVRTDTSTKSLAY